jgi:hypothetical protein
MIKISLEKIDNLNFNLKSDNDLALKLELKPSDIDIYNQKDDCFYIKLKKTIFNLKLNKLIGMLQSEILKAIEYSSYYFDYNINFEKIFKIIEGNIIIKVIKNDVFKTDEIFYKDTKKIILKFERLQILNLDDIGKVIKVIINFDLEKSKIIPIFFDNLFEEIH